MSKVIKISDSTILKLTKLMNALQETGCSSEEKLKAHKIFKIYLDGKTVINKKNAMISGQKKKKANKLIINKSKLTTSKEI